MYHWVTGYHGWLASNPLLLWCTFDVSFLWKVWLSVWVCRCQWRNDHTYAPFSSQAEVDSTLVWFAFCREEVKISRRSPRSQSTNSALFEKFHEPVRSYSYLILFWSDDWWSSPCATFTYTDSAAGNDISGALVKLTTFKITGSGTHRLALKLKSHALTHTPTHRDGHR